MLMRLGPVLSLAPRAERDPQPAEGDREQRAHDRERDDNFEQGEAALVHRGLGGPPLSSSGSAGGAVRRVAISTLRLPSQRTCTVTV